VLWPELSVAVISQKPGVEPMVYFTSWVELAENTPRFAAVHAPLVNGCSVTVTVELDGGFDGVTLSANVSSAVVESYVAV
jgi:hypothetical protein